MMKCPVDGETLVMTDRSGVEIDYCPKCRGVWLDRGELDKIIDRAAPPVPLTEPAREERAPQQPHPRADDRYRETDRDRGRDDDRDRDDYKRGKRYKKRESFLSELFDF